MKRMRVFGRLLAVVMVALLLALCGSCGKRNAKTVAGGSASVLKSGQAILNGRPIPPLADLLSELETLQKPPSVSPQLWASLKNELRDKLVSAFNDAKETSKLGGLTTGYVKARDLQWEPTSPDTTTDWGKLTWRYVNDGDYNQDGQVKIDDVTPVAMHYGQTVEANNSIQELIDEDEPYQDGDGIIDKDEDGLGASDDIETIAANFYADVACYEVFGREAQGNWVSMGTVPFSSRTQRDGERDVFSFPLNANYANYKYYKVRALSATPGSLAPPLGPEYWYHTDPFDPGNTIVESDVLELGAPVVTGVTPPPQGTPNVNVPFRATVTGASPYTYQWTFCLFASPQTSTDSVPSVIFSRPTVGNGTVQVTNRFGSSATFPFTIDIRSVMAPVIDAIYPSPAEGDEGTQVTFSAEARGVPTSYSWNFGGGAEPNTSSDPAPTVTLANPGPPYEATLTVSNDQGQDEMSFTLTVHGWAIEDVDVVSTVNHDICMARDQNDEPGISYQADSKDLKYAYRVGGVWQQPETVQAGILIPENIWLQEGMNNSLAFNPQPALPGVPEPAIAYEYIDYRWGWVPYAERMGWCCSASGMRFARKVSGLWVIQQDVLESTRDTDPSLAFYGSTPYVSRYRDSISCDLLLLHETSPGTWENPPLVIDNGPECYPHGLCPSLAIDGSEKVIAYRCNLAEGTDLRLARYTNMVAQPSVVEALLPSDVSGESPSLALNALGQAWIAYQATQPGVLKVARESIPPGGPWEIEVIDIEGSAAKWPSIAFSPSGVAGLCYIWRQPGTSNYCLKYIWNHAGAWEAPVEVSSSASCCSLVFTQDNRPSIAYVADGNLYYTELF